MTKYIDTHAHLFKEYFTKEEIEKMINSFELEGLDKIIIPSTNFNNFQEIIPLNKFDNVFLAFGIHPSEVPQDWSKKYFEKIDFNNIVAFGEIGIDLHYDDNPSLEKQKECFIDFLDMALEKDLPVLIHIRDSEEHVYRILKAEKYRNLKIVLHSFNLNWNWAEKFLALGAYLSFSGILTFKKNVDYLIEVAKNAPLDKILIETDTPHLTPCPFRGKTNNPIFAKYIGQKISEIKNLDQAIVFEQIYQNTMKIFNFKKVKNE